MTARRIDHTEHHAHWSLRFDAEPDLVARALVKLIRAEGLTLLTTTESRDRALVRALRRRLPAGYGVVLRFEYLIIWHRPTYRSHWLAALAVLDPRSWPMLGGRRLFRVARKRFTHRETGTRMRAEVGHAPSGVDGGPGHFATAHHDRVVIANDGFARWGRRARRYQRRHPRGALCLHMDSNLNQHAEQWRAFLTKRLAAASVYDLAGVPAHGSHGDRLIDTAHVVGLLVGHAVVYLGPRPHKLDHAPVTYTATYPVAGAHV